jgi:hypothetical protein
MPWDLLGHLGVLSLWAACGLVPWLVILLLRRAKGAFTTLPFAIAGGIVGGLFVVAFAKGWAGFATSLPVAMLVGAAASVAATRLSWNNTRADG